MKSIILAGAFMLLALTNTFAADINVTPSVQRTFRTEFRNVSDVKWTIVDQLYRADFVVDGERTIAFFSPKDGSLVATSHYLSVQDLPRELHRSLKPHMATGKLVELFEVEGNDSFNYYAAIQNGDKTTIFKSTGTSWVVYKK